MKRSFAAALGCVLLWAVPASADVDAPRTRALALIQKLEANTAAKQLLSTTLSEAKQALVRADRARKAGDHQHGAALETLALEWAELAGELERTAAAERAASELEKKRSELENKLDRTRMLIEQLNAQRARTEAELVKLQAEKAPAPQTSAAPATAKGTPGPATTAAPAAPASTSKAPAKATAPKTPPVPKAAPAPASKEKP
jgi:chaperonin cofactor prefoldin